MTKQKKQIIFIFACFLILIIVVLLLQNKSTITISSNDSNNTITARDSRAMSLTDLKRYANSKSLNKFFWLGRPANNQHLRINKQSNQGQVQIGYREKQKTKFFIVTNRQNNRIDTAPLIKTSSAQLSRNDFTVYLPPERLIRSGQLVALSEKNKLLAVISSDYSSKPALLNLAKKVRLVSSK